MQLLSCKIIFRKFSFMLIVLGDYYFFFLPFIQSIFLFFIFSFYVFFCFWLLYVSPFAACVCVRKTCALPPFSCPSLATVCVGVCLCVYACVRCLTPWASGVEGVVRRWLPWFPEQERRASPPQPRNKETVYLTVADGWKKQRKGLQTRHIHHQIQINQIWFATELRFVSMSSSLRSSFMRSNKLKGIAFTCSLFLCIWAVYLRHFLKSLPADELCRASAEPPWALLNELRRPEWLHL